ncbi:MAG TPA: BlaI/MecI/CopY family transcriptional regulator [Gemmatimonadaceae bacterium]|nr:BlaI/MecI/CopY family transcriptional regulator [Gemmatimonadaceae bacterium]
MPRRSGSKPAPPSSPATLSRRERGIMDALYRLGSGSVADVVAQLGDPEAHDSVRVTLGILEKKGVVTHRADGPRYIYAPAVPKERASKLAARDLLRTFFEGSPSRAILALLDESDRNLSAADLEEIEGWITAAKKQRRR